MNRRRGSLLIVTLWLVAVLSVLAITIARYLSLEVKLTKYHLAREQAKALARSGVYLAMQRLAADLPEAVDWLGDDWSFDATAPWLVPAAPGGDPGRDTHLEIVITDEERKLDLNSPRATQNALTALAGLPQVAQAVVDALDPPEPEREDRPEIPYYAKNGPMHALEELADLPEMQEHPDARAALTAESTVFADGRVNVNTASALVLEAIKPPDLAGLIRMFVDRRGAGADQQLGTADDCLLTSDAGSVQQIADCLGADAALVQNLVNDLSAQSVVFTIVSRGVVAVPPARYQVTAVVRRHGCPAEGPEPCIVAWREG